ncbi:ETX/MTX2 family pore-forming toxin [Bacillus toyonensis]|uniref:ETX/MTX2 family pore-forming toxin n=1 Tax=Bacillus cereus group TaxID=86661 RepID=UPI0026E459FA|nr:MULTISPECIES: ETX/MTX2 family pore-forming toxin [Bacillus cereus group]MDO6634157.1 ETX/MTX2 family pore-forming toxin [Bacillus thuringiensis]MDO6663572.1 ETX/MTX2 family pore-forming toxin [Bacillus thuringiensis]MDO6704300.1 ETX/MTX2 family pore-forming toxin [Bacillus thuringiensis]MED3485224.1 ETX/MTX2 family pore-forming toxin [Bacillus toyonensis]
MAIVDLDAYLLALSKKVLAAPFDPFISRVNTSRLAVKNAESYGFEIKESKPQGTMFIGESILNNRTNETQTLHSDSFTKTITDSVTLSVTTGITTGVNINIGGKIFGMGVETSMSFEVSTSTTNEQTNEESVAYTVPSQTVVVPAQTTYYVHTALERNQLEGIIRLRADLSGEFSAMIKVQDLEVPIYTGNIYDFVNQYQSLHPLPSGISLNHNTKSIHFEGIAEYLYGTGTKFHVTVTDKPSSQGTQEHKSFDAKTGLGTYPIGLNGKKLSLELNDLKEHMNAKDFEKLKELQNEVV